MSTEDERARKLKSQRLAKSTQESQIEEKTGDKIHNKILATLEALKTEIAQISRQMNVKEVKKRNKSPTSSFARNKIREQQHSKLFAVPGKSKC